MNWVVPLECGPMKEKVQLKMKRQQNKNLEQGKTLKCNGQVENQFAVHYQALANPGKKTPVVKYSHSLKINRVTSLILISSNICSLTEASFKSQHFDQNPGSYRFNFPACSSQTTSLNAIGRNEKGLHSRTILCEC